MPRTETIDVRGTEIELLSGGTGDALLFLHGVQGLSLQAGVWKDCLDSLAETFHVLYPSHPEFGGSGRPELCDTIEELAFHYLDLLDELGIEKAHVVGHSFGGWLAAELGMRHPSYVDRLVLSNPLGVWLTESPVPDLFSLNAQQVVELAYQNQDIGQTAGMLSMNSLLSAMVARNCLQPIKDCPNIFPV